MKVALMATPNAIVEDPAAFIAGLSRALSPGLGPALRITAVQRTPCPYASSYAAELLTVALQSGEQHSLFFKNLGCSSFPKDEVRLRRDREHRFYRDLFGAGELGTARYYGSLWDEPDGPFWLFLEHVTGQEARYCGIEHWIAGAAWLGRLHAYSAQHSDRLVRCKFLVRHDVEFFRSKAEPALRFVTDVSAKLADRLASALHAYDDQADLMAAQPATLVHGHYRPCNILVDAQHDAARICPIDWEQAAFGSPLYDLAYLVDGLEQPALDPFLDAYQRAAEAHGVVVADRAELRQVLACFRLFIPLHRLSRGRGRDLTEQRIERAVAAVERIGDEM